MDALRHAGRSDASQRAALEDIVRQDAHLMDALVRLRALDAPQWMLVAGAIYNSVWAHLTGKPPLTGVRDLDVAYFDAGDLSWEAEDAVIRRSEAAFAGFPVPVELRNQARVHLWFPQKFGMDFAPLGSAEEMLTRYASKTHAVGVRLDHADRISIHAPFGLDDLFAFRVTPNPVLDNRRAHEEKGARAKAIWPEIVLVPWPD